MKTFQSVLLVCLALVTTPAGTIGADLEPADYRGEPNSVMAKFDLRGMATLDMFSEGANPTFPLSTVPPGIVQDPTGGTFYQVTLPNYIDDLPLKLMRIQYSWFGQQGNAQTVAIDVVPNTGGLIQLVGSGPIVPVPNEPNAFHRFDDFEIRPNPDFEAIQIEFTNADPLWLVFDTISTGIPEPSGALLFLVAAVGWGLRRRVG